MEKGRTPVEEGNTRDNTSREVKFSSPNGATEGLIPTNLESMFFTDLLLSIGEQD